MSKRKAKPLQRRPAPIPKRISAKSQRAPRDMTKTERDALHLIYEADFFTAEFYENYYPGGKRVPAARWRWMAYVSHALEGIGETGSILFKRASHHRWSKSKLEASYAALVRLGLIEIRREDTPDILHLDSAKPPAPRTFIRLTARGRQMCRTIWGETPFPDLNAERAQARHQDEQ